MKDACFCGHDQIIHLTSQHDFENLNCALIQLLQELYPFTDLRIYYNKCVNEESDFELIFIHKHACLGSVKYIEEKDNKLLSHLNISFEEPLDLQLLTEDLVVFPIILHGLCFGAVVMENITNDNIEKQSLLTTYLTIYSNQLALLRSGNQDALTGLYNRQMFDNVMNRILNSSGRHRRQQDGETVKSNSWYLALLDIDHFKKINDTYGHLIGDEALLTLAQLMQQTFRGDDLLFRYGGEEFAIALKFVDELTTFKVLDRFRKTVANYQYPQIGHLTITIGFTELETGLLPPTIIQRADSALYFGKNDGRNQVNSYERLVRDGELSATHSTNNIELF